MAVPRLGRPGTDRTGLNTLDYASSGQYKADLRQQGVSFDTYESRIGSGGYDGRAEGSEGRAAISDGRAGKDRSKSSFSTKNSAQRVVDKDGTAVLNIVSSVI